MSIRIDNIKVQLDKEVDVEYLKKICAKKLLISIDEIAKFKIVRESVDARKRNIFFVYSVLVDLENDENSILRRLNDNNIRKIETKITEKMYYGHEKLKNRPVIIGMGPAGLFAGLVLSYNGYKPIILERGDNVDIRVKKVNKFWNNNVLDVDTNVQFGEGGAGTFSDGKLTTRINDTRQEYVFEKFVEFGAPEEILYRSKPHIGTDKLKNIVKNIRQKIMYLGGSISFNSKVTDISIHNECIHKISINNKDDLSADVVIFAIGHSARDTYKMLFERGVFIEQKAFSIGARIEHKQKLIDIAQYKDFAGHPLLRPAEYQLVYKEKDRACYSFCMCPGGSVVAAASEFGSIVTNGMSEYLRNGENANSALVVSVTPDDFCSNNPLEGIEYQRKWEKLAFEVGGRNYSAPVQKVKDFLDNKVSASFGNIEPSYTGGVALENLNKCLPGYVIDTMKNGIIYFDKKIKGFSGNDSILTGVETRTSAPVRITRLESGESISVKGLYPTGEGAGYAGGIVSAAVDGIKIAELIMRRYSPID
jgi:uncharacterized FAD-dependent dehydrogenase